MLTFRRSRFQSCALRLIAVQALILSSFLLFPTKVAAGVMVRLSGSSGKIDQVTEAGGTLWVLSEGTVYRVDDHRLDAVMKVPRSVDLAEVGGKLWIGTESGLYEARDELAPAAEVRFPIVDLDGRSVDLSGGAGIPIQTLSRRANEVWLGTLSAGLFKVDLAAQNGVRVKQESRFPVIFAKVLGDDLWVATPLGLLKIDRDGQQTQIEPRRLIPVTGIAKAGGDVWIVTWRSGTYGPLYRIENGVTTEFGPLRDKQIISVTEVDGEPWFAASDGVYRLHAGAIEAVEVAGLDEPVNTIAQIDDRIWIGGTRHSFCCGPDAFEPFPPRAGQDHTINVLGFFSAQGRSWLRTMGGLYRYDDDVDIEARPSTFPFFGGGLVFSRSLRFRPGRYRGADGSDPYGGAIDGKFKVTVAGSESELKQKIAAQKQVPLDTPVGSMPLGVHDVYLHVTDQFGNSPKNEVIESVVILPGRRILGVIALVALVISLPVLILRFSGSSRFLMGLVMAPAIRKLGTLGALQVLLGFERVRRWLLARYLRGVRSEATARSSAQAPTGVTTQIGRRLKQRRVLLVEGQQEDVVCTLRSLEYALAQRDPEWGEPERLLVPIFLRLETSASSWEILEEALEKRLATYGGITDRKVAKRILDDPTGILVFILCADRKLTGSEMQVVKRFVDWSSGLSSVVVGAPPGEMDRSDFDEVIRLDEILGTNELKDSAVS